MASTKLVSVVTIWSIGQTNGERVVIVSYGVGTG